MAVSSMVQAIKSVFNTPEYADRIPDSIKTAITNGNFGHEGFTVEANEVFSALVNKIARQDIYSFEYAGLDLGQFYKGTLPYGSILEDDYIGAVKARNTKPLPNENNTAGWDFNDGWNPFEVSYAPVKSAYYSTKVLFQYLTTTSEDMFKRAFISEQGAVDFVSRHRAVLPQSLSMDMYLVFREMLSANDAGHNIYASTVEIPVAGDHFTVQESVDTITKIQNIVSALKYNTTEYNKAGVLVNTPSDRLILFITEGIYNEILNSQYSAFNRVLDLGVTIQRIDGFGNNALTSGQFACLLDTRAIKLFDWLTTRMETVHNPMNVGYWNTILTRGILLGYNLFANSVKFVLTDGTSTSP